MAPNPNGRAMRRWRGDIDRATEQIQSIRAQLQRHDDVNAGLLKKATLGLKDADQLRLKMVDEVTRVKKVIDDLSFIWVDLCTHERITVLPRNVFDFIATVQGEVARRYSMTIDAIVEQCQRTRFLLEDAETLIRSDLSAVLLREHQELSSHFGVVDSLAAAYSAAKVKASEASKGFVEKFWSVFKKKK